MTGMPAGAVRDRTTLPASLLFLSQVVVHGSLRHSHAHTHTHMGSGRTDSARVEVTESRRRLAFECACVGASGVESGKAGYADDKEPGKQASRPLPSSLFSASASRLHRAVVAVATVRHLLHGVHVAGYHCLLQRHRSHRRLSHIGVEAR